MGKINNDTRVRKGTIEKITRKKWQEKEQACSLYNCRSVCSEKVVGSPGAVLRACNYSSQEARAWRLP